MSETLEGSRRGSTINLRLSEKDKALLDQAAAVAGKTRTDFVLESARREAIDTLLDQRLFLLDDEQFAAFQRVLEKPAKANQALKKLMATKPPWER